MKISIWLTALFLSISFNLSSFAQDPPGPSANASYQDQINKQNLKQEQAQLLETNECLLHTAILLGEVAGQAGPSLTEYLRISKNDALLTCEAGASAQKKQELKIKSLEESRKEFYSTDTVGASVGLPMSSMKPIEGGGYSIYENPPSGMSAAGFCMGIYCSSSSGSAR
jgi:hypothetical protein